MLLSPNIAYICLYMALYDQIKDKYLYSDKDFDNIQDYKLGDIVEAEVGVFMQVIDKGEHMIHTEQLAVIPEPNTYKDKYGWENATNNMLLDLICDAKNEKEKNLYIDLMKHVKKRYPYERFKKELGEIRK